MSTQNTLQIRIDTKTKNAARKILNELGVDMSTAVKMFLRNVVITESIPLELRTQNGYTLAEEQEMTASAAIAKRNGKRFSSAQDLLADLEN